MLSAVMSFAHSTADQIRHHLAQVSHLHAQAQTAGLAQAVHTIKRLQAQRFRGSYQTFLASPRQAPATRFFLDELYGEHDFSQRDAQFGRIAGAIERLFPAAVGQLAVSLAEMHALTETLDHQLATHWLAAPHASTDAQRYLWAWRQTGERPQRERQLVVVQHMGQELQRLTRSRSLLLGLKMMRGPAQAAGLSMLQGFLESGFSAFVQLGDATSFLEAITGCERDWVQRLFDADADAMARAIEAALQAAS